MIVGSLAGSICAGGGFCAGSSEAVEHQRINAAAYTYSAALPAMLAMNASEVVGWFHGEGARAGAGPYAGKGGQADVLKDRIQAMRAQLDPRSDWVKCTSTPENPTLLLVLKPEVIESRNLSSQDQEALFQEVVDEVCQLLHLYQIYSSGTDCLDSARQTTSSSLASSKCPHRTARRPATSRPSGSHNPL